MLNRKIDGGILANILNLDSLVGRQLRELLNQLRTMVSFLLADVLHHPDVAGQLSHREDNLVSRPFCPLGRKTPLPERLLKQPKDGSGVWPPGRDP